LTLAESNAGATSVLINEFDTGSFKSLFQNSNGCAPRFGDACFYLSDSHYAQPRMIREILLAPVKETSGSSALRCCYHGSNMPDSC
jgi:hypothetical protein